MSSVNIRNLGPEDAYILDRVRAGLSPDALGPSRVWAFLATRVNELVVALDQGEVVGFASGTTLMHPNHPTEFLISTVVVHPDLRRHGVGSRLMRRIMELAEERGCVHMSTRAHKGNLAFTALAASLNAQKIAGDLVFRW